MTDAPAALPSAEPVSRPGLRRATQAFTEPAYRWWFASQLLSASGTMTQAVAQSWLVLQITGRAVDLGVLTAITWLPVLLGGAWAGAWVGRLNRRSVLLVTQSLFVVVGLTLAAVSATGKGTGLLYAIYALSFVSGSATAFDSPARQLYVLELVGRARLASAVSMFEVMLNASRVLGPATGGALLVTLGPTACFLVNGLGFVPALIVLLGNRPTHRAPDQPSERASVLDGLRYVWRAPDIRACLLIAVAGGMLFNLGASLPPLVTQAFQLDADAYGGLMAAYGLGAIPGALVAAGGSAWPTGRRVRALCALAGAAVVATAFSPTPVGAFVLIAVTGFLSIWLIAVANTLVQLRARPDLRGSVMGAWTVALPGTLPLTGPMVGGVGQLLGARAGFALAGFALVVAAAVGWRALADR